MNAISSNSFAFSIRRTFVIFFMSHNCLPACFPDVMTTVSRLLTLSRHGSRLFAVAISDNRWSWSALWGAKSDVPRTMLPKPVCHVFFSYMRQFYIILTSMIFRWFSRIRLSCLLPQGVEKCADNARAFNGVIKGLNPRSFARSTTLILSTTLSEPTTRQAINFCTAIRLHDCLAQISLTTMQPFTNKHLLCPDKVWCL